MAPEPLDLQQLRRMRAWFLPLCAGAAVISATVFVRWYLYARPEPTGEQLLALLVAMPLAIAGWVADRYARAQLAGRGCCPKCGYDLRASPQRCPECGLPVAEHKAFIRTAGNPRPTRRRLLITFFAIFAGHLLLIPLWRVAVGAFGWGSLFAGMHVMNTVLASIIFAKLLRARQLGRVL